MKKIHVEKKSNKKYLTIYFKIIEQKKAKNGKPRKTKFNSKIFTS